MIGAIRGLLLAGLLLAARPGAPTEPIIIDHRCTDFSQIPSAWIDRAVAALHIVYTHTSHGSQLTTGMQGLARFKGDPRLDFATGGTGGKLDLDDDGCAPYGAYDLGNPNRTAWAAATRAYLADHPQTNVVVWSWCGEVNEATQEDIDIYLSLMEGLERDFPGVVFVYMTGHVIEGARGNNHLRNEQIRAFCRERGKVLYDFADIECYDPDGNYFGDRWCTDGCLYDANGDGNPWNDGANWAVEWQNAHVQGVDWYDCPSAHSEPLNANQKAYAAWWLWARLAGWDGFSSTGIELDEAILRVPVAFRLEQNYPNPFNTATWIAFWLPAGREVRLTLYDRLGREIAELLRGYQVAGEHSLKLGTDELASGVYLYRLQAGDWNATKRCVLVK